MKRNTMLKILNPILGLLLISQMLSGIFRRGLTHEQFEILHKFGGFVLTGAVVLHVILNWNWIKGSFFKRTSATK